MRDSLIITRPLPSVFKRFEAKFLVRLVVFFWVNISWSWAAEAPVLEPTDFFPEKAQLKYANCFNIEYHAMYKRIEVSDACRNSRHNFVYILVPRGQKAPPDTLKTAIVVSIPVDRMAIFSSAWTAYFAMLHIEDKLVGLAGCEYVNTPEVLALIREGKIKEIGDGGRGMSRKIHLERLTLVRPEAVMVYATGIPDYDQYPKLMEAGFKAIINASHMEASPLGRTEWIKFIAAFFNREAEAEHIFDEIVLHYEKLAEKTRNVAHRPTVLSNAPWRGLWHIPGGASYNARFVEDAGARYLWRDNTSAGSIPMSIEAVVERARDAEYWINPGLARSLAELKGVDERFRLFTSFRSGRVYNNDARVNPQGGNDYWETGAARPDLVLADLISIFHPELVPDHRRIWYRQLPAVTE